MLILMASLIIKGYLNFADFYYFYFILRASDHLSLTNTVNPYQTPHIAGSGLGLHFLSMFLLQDSSNKLVRTMPVSEICSSSCILSS